MKNELLIYFTIFFFSIANHRIQVLVSFTIILNDSTEHNKFLLNDYLSTRMRLKYTSREKLS